MNSSYEGSYNYHGNVPPEMAGLGLAVLGGFLLFILILVLIIYVYMAICLMKMAKKTNTENAWFAWVPILNIILMLNIAQKPIWWIVLFFVPFVNIVFSILVWMAIAKNLGKPEWLGVLMIVPIANFIIPGYLAFSKDETPAAPVSPEPPISPAPPTQTI